VAAAEQTVSAIDKYRRTEAQPTGARSVGLLAATAEARLAQAARAAPPVWEGGPVVVVVAAVLAVDDGDSSNEENYDIQII
jgi:hypothetical protein